MFSESTIEELRTETRGRLLQPTDDSYNGAREVWNAMIDRRPAVIVQARGVADIIAAISFAREQNLDIAIKGGGHNVAGHGVCEQGLMLDLSQMKSVRVNPTDRTARVEPGAVLHDLDLETQVHGLATPAGFISSTGVAGLTLGGGIGYLSRKFGLTVDNLQSAELVTAQGEFVQASDDQHPDLFWALQGGGGNFGVVTSFEFGLHEIGPTVLSGPVVWSFEDAPVVLREVSGAMREAPDGVSCLPILRYAPPAPFLPEEVHGKMVLIVAMIYAGHPGDGQAALAPLREIGAPIADAVSEMPYVKFQSLFDGAAGPGARNYWKSHYFAELSDHTIDTLCEHAAQMTSQESVIGMLSLGGAVARKSSDSTPYPHRDARWVVNIQARWREAEEDDQHIAWTRRLYDALSPSATGGLYINFMAGDEGDQQLRAAYGENTYNRLSRVKAVWDPQNIFHMNQNIIPKS